MFWLIIFSVAYAGSTENPHPTYQSDPVLKGFRSQTLNPGDNLTLSCTLSGLGDKEKVRFTWERNGEIVQDSLVSIDSGYSGVVWYSRVYLEQVTGATGAGWWKCKAGALSETARIDVAGSTKLLNPENTLGVERESGELNRVGRIGEDIVLYCPYQGTPPTQFTWWTKGRRIGESTRFRFPEPGLLRVLNLTVSEQGTYTCRAKVQEGEDLSGSIQLTVIDSPEWVAPPQDSRVTLGSRLVLDCRVRGEPKPEIEWTRRGAVLNPVTWDGYKIYENGTLEIISTRLRDQGEYTCSASNSVLPHLSRSVQVQLNVGAYFYPEQDELQGERREKVGEQDGSEDIDDETLKDLQQSIRVRSEERVILSCNPHGDPPLEIYWFRDNKPIPSPNHRFKIKNEDKNGTVSKEY
ncbi:neuroglian-like [Eurytemora carolleeae]|uniref:neuroglian-like n=1 Tax=Eurytemora carolleeae TaxID=1294199 RepID=UPI000C76075D|nr:neuroglian-like [Eurytemora carolleeae]|eukprot:XP_023335205.1 neuroglian-like [Eurytemora affinis]